MYLFSPGRGAGPLPTLAKNVPPAHFFNAACPRCIFLGALPPARSASPDALVLKNLFLSHGIGMYVKKGLFLAKAGSGFSPWPGEDKYPTNAARKAQGVIRLLKNQPLRPPNSTPALYTREATTRTQPMPPERKIPPIPSASGEALSAGGRAPFEEAFQLGRESPERA